MVVLHFGDVSAHVEGVAEPHHKGAPSWSADPIEVISDGFNRSVTLNGVRQMQGFSHGITLEIEAVLGICDWT